jgi:hypothetical protein
MHGGRGIPLPSAQLASVRRGPRKDESFRAPLKMRLPRVGLKLWTIMVLVAVAGCAMAELSQRRMRLARLFVALHDRADAYVERAGGYVCKLGETPQSIEASYRRRGPEALGDYRTAAYLFELAAIYDRAANRQWVPMLGALPPAGGLRHLGALAEWVMEALIESTPLFAIAIGLVALRRGSRATTVPCQWSASAIERPSRLE